MIRLENTATYGWEAAIRGMRNPMNSWDKSDSEYTEDAYVIGKNDIGLMRKLAKAGDVHGKFLRMITVTVDITAPLYWWKEFDTYKVGTVANSCSTMHKIAAKPFTMGDFSTEHLETIGRFNAEGEVYQPYMVLKNVVDCLNACRDTYLQTQSKTDWWQMIQLLPSSYNQRRTVQLNYSVLSNIYEYRRNHKLDEWIQFCTWIRCLPYSELILKSC